MKKLRGTYGLTSTLSFSNWLFVDTLRDFQPGKRFLWPKFLFSLNKAKNEITHGWLVNQKLKMEGIGWVEKEISFEK